MKLRQSERPFLVVWVDNAELLKPFSPVEELNAHAISEAVWLMVQEIIENVESTIGPDVGPELKASETYQSYQGLCHEARYLYANDQLYKESIGDLQEYAERVVKIHRGEWTEPIPPAEPPTVEPPQAPAADEKAQPAGGILGRLFDRLRGK
jgi:hypothetical protein